MEACPAVYKEHVKVNEKLKGASESTSKKLQDTLNELTMLKNRLKEGI